jgi:hypothetical protein
MSNLGSKIGTKLGSEAKKGTQWREELNKKSQDIFGKFRGKSHRTVDFSNVVPPGFPRYINVPGDTSTEDIFDVAKNLYAQEHKFKPNEITQESFDNWARWNLANGTPGQKEYEEWKGIWMRSGAPYIKMEDKDKALSGPNRAYATTENFYAPDTLHFPKGQDASTYQTWMLAENAHPYFDSHPQLHNNPYPSSLEGLGGPVFNSAYRDSINHEVMNQYYNFDILDTMGDTIDYNHPELENMERYDTYGTIENAVHGSADYRGIEGLLFNLLQKNLGVPRDSVFYNFDNKTTKTGIEYRDGQIFQDGGYLPERYFED